MAAIPAPELGPAGRVCLVLLAVLGIGALAGGAMLVADSDGSAMGTTVAVLAGSPFPDFLIPGLVLAGLFGVGSFIVVAMALRRLPIAPFLAFAIGCAQMIWITVETWMVRDSSLLQPTFFGYGPAHCGDSGPLGAGRHCARGGRPVERAGRPGSILRPAAHSRLRSALSGLLIYRSSGLQPVFDPSAGRQRARRKRGPPRRDLVAAGRC